MDEQVKETILHKYIYIYVLSNYEKGGDGSQPLWLAAAQSVLPSDGPQRSQRKHKINTRVGNEEERQWHATKPRQGNKRDKEETTCLQTLT